MNWAEPENPDYNAYVTYDDPRYPTVVIRVGERTAGYSLNTSTMELTRVCICFAHSSTECGCGAWDLDID